MPLQTAPRGHKVSSSAAQRSKAQALLVCGVSHISGGSHISEISHISQISRFYRSRFLRFLRSRFRDLDFSDFSDLDFNSISQKSNPDFCDVKTEIWFLRSRFLRFLRSQKSHFSDLRNSSVNMHHRHQSPHRPAGLPDARWSLSRTRTVYQDKTLALALALMV